MDKMDDRAAKFKKYIEQLPRLCSPTICGTLSQPLTKSERSSRNSQFEWSLEQKAILSPANITTATCSDIGEVDPSFLHQESEQFFSQKTIAPSPMTTPSTRTYSRSQPPHANRLYDYMFDERDEDTEEEEEEDDDDDEEEDNDVDDDDRMQAAQRPRQQHDDDEETNSDTDIDMDALDETQNHSETEIEDESDEDDEEEDEMTDDESHKSDDDYDDAAMRLGASGHQDMDSLFLSPPLRSSQTQQRIIFSPEAFGDRTMDDETTLQSTPKINGSQVFRTRTRRGSDMSD